MPLIYSGLALFLAPHLFSGWARPARASLIGAVGELPYKLVYTVLSLIGMALTIKGWRGMDVPDMVYTPPAWGRDAALVIMPIASILIVAAYVPTGRIKSFVGHPMVLGTILFSLSHLLANGDERSVTVFGALLLYGVFDRLAVKLRGDRGPRGTSLVGDGLAVIVGLGLSAAMALWLHPYVSGVGLYLF